MGIIGISSCTNDNFVEPSTETTRAEIIHEKLTYEQFSKKVDEKNDFDKSLKHSFQENYISSTKGLVKIANTDEGDSEILIDYFFDPVHGNETYSFITHEFTGETENDYLEKFVLTIEDGEGERTAFLRYYPTTDFSEENFSGNIEISTLDRSYIATSYVLNGITMTEQSNSVQTDCIKTITIKSTRCGNPGNNHRYGEQCSPGFTNNAYLYVTTNTVCKTTILSDAPVFSSKIIEPGPIGSNGGSNTNSSHNVFINSLSANIKTWLNANGKTQGTSLLYLSNKKYSQESQLTVSQLLNFIVNDDVLRNNDFLAEIITRQILFSNKYTLNEFVSFWSGLTHQEKQVFNQFVNNNLTTGNSPAIKPATQTFLLWAFNYLIDNPTVNVEQIENWFMMKSEGIDGEILNNIDTILSTLSYQTKQMPKYSEFVNAFPKLDYPGYPGYYTQMPASQVYSIVGNPLNNLYISEGGNNGPYRNACTVRWSLAMNRLGINIPQNSLSLRGANVNSVPQYFYIRAITADDAMGKIFGNPTHQLTGSAANDPTIVANFLRGKTGIYIIVNNNATTAGYTGHVDLIQNGHVPGGANAYNVPGGVKSIKIWEFTP